MKIKSLFTFLIDIWNQIDLYFNYHVFHLQYCVSWIVILIIRFDLMKILFFFGRET